MNNLPHQVLKQGLLHLNDVLKNLEPLHKPLDSPGGSVLLRELVTAPELTQATSNPQVSPDSLNEMRMNTSTAFNFPTTAGDTVVAPHVRRARLYPDVCTCLPHWTGRYQVSLKSSPYCESLNFLGRRFLPQILLPPFV